MKLLLLIFAFLLFASQAQQVHKNNNLRGSSGKGHSLVTAAENSRISAENPLYSKLREFGIQEVAKKALTSHGVQFTATSPHKVYSVRTSSGSGLEVTFEVDIRDVYGKDHRATFVVSYQSWKNNLMKLEKYTLAK